MPDADIRKTAEKPVKKGRLRRHRRLLLWGGPLLFMIVATAGYFMTGRYVSTDDAYVDAARTDISSNISGRVVAVDVHDNQIVRKGDILFRLDDRDLKIAVTQAQARLAEAKLDVAAREATYKQRLADVAAAKSTLAYAQSELRRQSKLARKGIASRARRDAAQNAFNEAAQKLAAAEQQSANVLASLGGNAGLAVDDHPSVEQAEAALDQAKLNLSYAVIRAPSAGIVAGVDRLQVGTYIKSATPVFALVSDHDIWISANFKETALTYMRPGQPVAIDIDAYPDRVFHGTVTSVSPGTGESFSVLPAENATGNWVKVVQRLPVRISISGDLTEMPLRAGLSADVTVDTHHSRLRRFHIFERALAREFKG